MPAFSVYKASPLKKYSDQGSAALIKLAVKCLLRKSG
jgi:hypothetical protein